MHGATPEGLFQRCSGDFQQVANADKVNIAELVSRLDFGVLLNTDEAYDLLMAFSYISEESSRDSKSGLRVNAHQSAMNKLIQYGQASRVTKTSGSFGEGSPPNVTVGGTGNLHPAIYVPMERAEIGTHHAAGKERFAVATGRPVQPHEALPQLVPMR